MPHAVLRKTMDSALSGVLLHARSFSHSFRDPRWLFLKLLHVVVPITELPMASPAVQCILPLRARKLAHALHSLIDAVSISTPSTEDTGILYSRPDATTTVIFFMPVPAISPDLVILLPPGVAYRIMTGIPLRGTKNARLNMYGLVYIRSVMFLSP